MDRWYCEVIKSIIRIFQAIKCAAAERTRQSRQFKQKQHEIYNESLVEVKLNEQLQFVLDEMIRDHDINYVKIRIAPTAMPFITEAISHLPVEVIECAEKNEFLLVRGEESL